MFSNNPSAMRKNPFLKKDFVLSPFRKAGPWPAIILVSIAAGILILFIFKLTSNQERLKRKKNKVLARVLEFVLFRDDIVVTLGAFKRVILGNFAYLSEVLVPLAASLIPLLLVLVQLSAWFTYRPLVENETTVLTARLPDNLPVLKQNISLETSDGIRVDSKAVRAPSVNEISWRLKAGAGSDEWVELKINGTSIRKTVALGPKLSRISESREQRRFWTQLLYPSEAPLSEEAPVVAVRIQYPERDLVVGGMHLHWLVVFFVLSMVAGFVLMKPLGITI